MIHASLAQLPISSSTDVGGIDPLSAVFVLLFAVDEILPFLGGRFKQYNGIIQSASRLIGMARPLRGEDEQVEEIRKDLESVRRRISRLGR